MDEQIAACRRESDARLLSLEARIKNIEECLAENTKLTQELMDMVRVGKTLRSLILWLLGVAASVATIWRGGAPKP